MPRTLVTLPCTARELEAALHAYCDHHGAWNMEADVVKGTRPDMPEYACVALALYPAPSESAATETTNPTNKE